MLSNGGEGMVPYLVSSFVYMYYLYLLNVKDHPWRNGVYKLHKNVSTINTNAKITVQTPGNRGWGLHCVTAGSSSNSRSCRWGINRWRRRILQDPVTRHHVTRGRRTSRQRDGSLLRICTRPTKTCQRQLFVNWKIVYWQASLSKVGCTHKDFQHATSPHKFSRL